MAKKSRMSVLKRQRELRKQEQKAIKKERREQQRSETTAGESADLVATADDLAGYGFPSDDEEQEPEENTG